MDARAASPARMLRLRDVVDTVPPVDRVAGDLDLVVRGEVDRVQAKGW